MADDILIPTPKTNEELAASNAEVVRKAGDQGNDLNRPASAEDFKSVSEGLDAFAEAISKKKEVVPEPVVVKPVEPAPDAAKVAAELAERTALEERAETFFKDSPKLPPNASPKSAESFREIKIRAAQELSARETEIEKLKKDIAERDEKLKNPVPVETENELKELREFRAKLDIETDPKFKEFDSQADSIREFIYAQLRKSPNVQADSLIEKIKSYGGPEMVEWTKIFEGLKDPTLEKIISAKLSDIEMAKFNKEQAIQSAKKNIQQYVTDRSSQATKALKGHNDATKTHLDGLTSKLDFLKPQTADAKADEATKKLAEGHNAWLKNTNELIQTALTDDSPEVRALMIAGMAQLLHLQRVHDATNSAHAATKAEHEKTKTELAAAQASIAKFKGASVNRIRESGAPPNGTLPKPKSDEQRQFNTPATQAIDDLARELMERRQAAV